MNNVNAPYPFLFHSTGIHLMTAILSNILFPFLEFFLCKFFLIHYELHEQQFCYNWFLKKCSLEKSPKPTMIWNNNSSSKHQWKNHTKYTTLLSIFLTVQAQMEPLELQKKFNVHRNVSFAYLFKRLHF